MCVGFERTIMTENIPNAFDVVNFTYPCMVLTKLIKIKKIIICQVPKAGFTV